MGNKLTIVINDNAPDKTPDTPQRASKTDTIRWVGTGAGGPWTVDNFRPDNPLNATLPIGPIPSGSISAEYSIRLDATVGAYEYDIRGPLGSADPEIIIET